MRFTELILLSVLLAAGSVSQGQEAAQSIKNAAVATSVAVDCKAILEKFAQAYSALDDKALTALTDKPEAISAGSDPFYNIY